MSGLKADQWRGHPAKKICDLCDRLEPEDETHLLLRCTGCSEHQSRVIQTAQMGAKQDLSAGETVRLRALFGVTATSDKERFETMRKTLSFMRSEVRRREEKRRERRERQELEKDVAALSLKYLDFDIEKERFDKEVAALSLKYLDL